MAEAQKTKVKPILKIGSISLGAILALIGFIYTQFQTINTAAAERSTVASEISRVEQVTNSRLKTLDDNVAGIIKEFRAQRQMISDQSTKTQRILTIVTNGNE